jgi:type IV secretion system protein TrbL
MGRQVRDVRFTKSLVLVTDMEARVFCVVFLAVMATLLVLPVEVIAQARLTEGAFDQNTASPNQVAVGAMEFTRADQLIERFAGMLETMGASAGKHARQLLLALFAIDLVLSIGRGIIAEESFAQMVQRLVTRVAFVSVVFLFINNVSLFTNWLAGSAVQLGQEAAGTGTEITPKVSGIFADGARLASQMIKSVSAWQPLTVLYVFTAFFTLLIAGLVMALVLTVYIELYIVALTGMIVLGFGGIETSKDSVMTYLRTLIGKAFKILGLLIIFAIMSKVINEVAGTARTSSGLGLELVMTIVILQAVQVLLLLTIPSTLEGLAGGVGSSRAAEVMGGFLAASVAKPLAKGGAGVAAGGASGAVQGAAKGMSEGLSQGGASSAIKGALAGAFKGAGSTAGRYGTAGFMRGRSLRAEMAKDLAAMMKKEG